METFATTVVTEAGGLFAFAGAVWLLARVGEALGFYRYQTPPPPPAPPGPPTNKKKLPAR